MRNTKIVCTVGPRTDSYEMIEKMIDLGVNVFRINTSHGDWNEQEQKILKIKELREKRKTRSRSDRSCGSEDQNWISRKRVCRIERGPDLHSHHKGNTWKRTYGFGEPQFSSTGREKGDTILLSDGEIVLEVIETTDTEVKTVVKVGGKITHRRGVNVPTADLSVESITDRDREFIKLGTLHNVEFFALSL